MAIRSGQCNFCEGLNRGLAYCCSKFAERQDVIAIGKEIETGKIKASLMPQYGSGLRLYRRWANKILLMIPKQCGFISFAVLALTISASLGVAQSTTVDAAAREQIDAGNRAWVNGMKNGDVSSIAATYADNALDCPATGDCFKGKSAIYEHLKQRLTQMGKAQSASVTSAGAVRQRDYIYEWGVAQASFADGRSIKGHYLTVWQLQSDGSWKIFRNLAIPDDRRE
jgi:ketosteroid isomerase-like protein